MLHPDVEKELKERGFLNKKRITHDYKSKEKICSACKTTYPRTNEFFRKESSRRDGLSYICKKCAADICKRSNEKNREKRKVYSKTPNSVYSQLKYQAKKRGYSFEITEKYYAENLINKPCHYCGTKETKHWIDRYDNSVGYTEKNSVPCCQRCNRMKSHRSSKDFINHCRKVANYNK